MTSDISPWQGPWGGESAFSLCMNCYPKDWSAVGLLNFFGVEFLCLFLRL